MLLTILNHFLYRCENDASAENGVERSAGQQERHPTPSNQAGVRPITGGQATKTNRSSAQRKAKVRRRVRAIGQDRQGTCHGVRGARAAGPQHAPSGPAGRTQRLGQ